MSSTIGDYSGHEPYIYPMVDYYKCVRSGWGCCVRKKFVPNKIYGYALSFVGFSKLLELKKLPTIFLNADKIRDKIVNLNPGEHTSIVTSPLVLNEIPEFDPNDEFSDAPRAQHTISLFVRIEGNRCLLFINDSAGSNYSYHYKTVKKILNLPYDLQLFVSRVNRQISGETCLIFALRDCKLLTKNPDCMDEILKFNGLEGEQELGIHYIDKMPPSFMVSEEVMSAKAKKLLDFFVANYKPRVV